MIQHRTHFSLPPPHNNLEIQKQIIFVNCRKKCNWIYAQLSILFGEEGGWQSSILKSQVR